MTQSHCSPYPVIQIEWLQAVRKTNDHRDKTVVNPRDGHLARSVLLGNVYLN